MAPTERPKKKVFFRRRKVCKFCVDKIDYVDYKDIKLLQGFIPERAKILPRRISGTCARHQRHAAAGDQAGAPPGADPVHHGLGGSRP